MGVRSSVEVKSINSMQGKKGTAQQSDVRKSAQAASMQSLIEQAPAINFYPQQEEGRKEVKKENKNPLSYQQQPATRKSGRKKELQQQAEELKKERAALRTKLDAYQKDFMRLYNRRIKFRNDIKPVQDEFKRYKDLKEDIAQLETLILEA